MRRTIPMLVVVLVVAVMPLTALANGQFTDDDGSVHEGDIERLAALDITRGCNPPDNDNFCPDDPVTRGQMAAFLVRALELPTGDDTFADTQGHLFQEDIASLSEAGITRGCNPPDNDNFCPDDPVTRGQMASFLVRAIDSLTPTWTVMPADGQIGGNGYAELVVKSWGPLLETSTDEDWWSDPTSCGSAFSADGVYFGPIWTGEGDGFMECPMPAGEALYLAPAGLVCVEGLDAPTIQECFDYWWDEVGVESVTATIDGIAITDLGPYDTGPFTTTMPENNWYEAPAGTYNAEAREYAAVVLGLEPGVHEVFVSSTWGDGFTSAATLILTVE